MQATAFERRQAADDVFSRRWGVGEDRLLVVHAVERVGLLGHRHAVELAVANMETHGGVVAACAHLNGERGHGVVFVQQLEASVLLVLFDGISRFIADVLVNVCTQCKHPSCGWEDSLAPPGLPARSLKA